ncbi:MAG: class B sortase [Sarcina sp.]
MKTRKKRKKLGIALIILVVVALTGIYGYVNFTYKTYMNMDLNFANNSTITSLNGWTNPIEKVGNLQEYYTKAHDINNGVIGWIAIPGTNINYPVNHGKGDSYYLKHNWKGDSYWNGSIFVSQENSGFDNVTLINGHNMLNGIMFSQLMNFTNKDFFSKNDIYVYNGQAGKIEDFKPIAAMYCEPDISLTLGNLTQEQREQEVSNLMKNSMYGQKTYNGANVLLLNTCLSNGSGKHLLVVSEEVQ